MTTNEAQEGAGAAGTSAPHMDELRKHLLDTLGDLRSRTNPMEPDRARAVAEVAGVLVDSARVEVDYLRVTGQQNSRFLEQPPDAHVAHLGNNATPEQPRNGITTITRHRIRG